MKKWCLIILLALLPVAVHAQGNSGGNGGGNDPWADRTKPGNGGNPNIPEPSTYGLVMVGIMTAGYLIYRRKKFPW